MATVQPLVLEGKPMSRAMKRATCLLVLATTGAFAAVGAPEAKRNAVERAQFRRKGEKPVTPAATPNVPESPFVHKRPGARPLCPVVFAADGQTVIWGEHDAAIYFWEPRTGKVVRKDWGWFVALSPDGKTMVVVAEDRKAYLLLNAVSGKVLQRFAADGGRLLLPDRAAAFTPDGTILALAQVKGIDVWDLATGKKLRRIEGGQVGQFGFSPDGRRLAIARDPSLLLIDLSTGERQFLIPPYLHATNIGAAYCPPFAFSLDGATLAAGLHLFWTGTDRPNRVRFFDVTTGEELAGWPLPNLILISALALSPDGKTLAMGRTDGEVWLWETAAGAVRARLREHTNGVGALAFSPDGASMASVGSYSLLVVCDVTGRAQAKGEWHDLSRRQREAVWEALGGPDPEKAFAAMGSLASAPDEASAFLQERLAALHSPDKALLARLVADLDDDRFAVREEAGRRLEQLGALAEPALRRALTATTSAEVRQRLTALLKKWEGRGGGERLRVSRSIEVLERLARPRARFSLDANRGLDREEVLDRLRCPSARSCLEALAREAEWPTLRREARDALDRLSRRPWP
jgi:hypothetical protein